MAEIDVKLVLDVQVTLTLNEREAAALDALAGYGTDAFLKCFYKHMGEAYLRPYESGLKSLFAKIRSMPREATETTGRVRRAIRDLESKERKARQANIDRLNAAAKPREAANG